MTKANVAGLSPRAKALLDGLMSSNIIPGVNPRSAYRDPATNARVGGAKGSQHLHGNALDFSMNGWTDIQKQAFLDKAVALGARGIGIYPGNSLHVDVRQNPTFWGTNGSYHSQPISSAPAWAQSTLSKMFGGSVAAAPAAPASRQPLPDVIGEVMAAAPPGGGHINGVAPSPHAGVLNLAKRAADLVFGPKATAMVGSFMPQGGPPVAPPVGGLDTGLAAAMTPTAMSPLAFGPVFNGSQAQDQQVDPRALLAQQAIGLPMDIPFDAPRPAPDANPGLGIPSLAEILGVA